MHVGRELRAARELHGLSLDELSARTKIGLERLKAIEDEDVDSLPPLVYLKGFIHAYAAEVGLDPIATTQLYLHRIERHALAEFNSEDAEDVFAEAPRSGEDDGPLTVTLGDSSIESRVIARLARKVRTSHRAHLGGYCEFSHGRGPLRHGGGRSSVAQCWGVHAVRSATASAGDRRLGAWSLPLE